MKLLLLSMLLFWAAGTVLAETVVAEYRWGELAETGPLPGGEIVQKDGRTVLKVVNTNNAPLQLPILEITKPEIASRWYALTGEVSYKSVEGEGYLETWNYFPPEEGSARTNAARYFSRTLASTGPMSSITGTSGWRGFALPFRITSGSARPERIEFNLFLPGEGTVYLSGIKLLDGPDSLGGVTERWWSDATGGWVGGLGGAVLGCVAGLFATLAAKGKARGLVLGGTWVMVGVGFCAAAGGVIALLLKQPYGVWFPLLLLGLLLLLILPLRVRDFRRSYETLEMRRMSSLDS